VIAHPKNQDINNHFMARDDMIVHRYNLLHEINLEKERGFKANLTYEFVPIKKRYETRIRCS